MDKTISLAKKTPIAIAFISGIFIASYMFTGLQVEATIGRPSSTHAIGYMYAPIYSLIVAAIGYIFGLILKYFLLKRGERDKVNKYKFLRNVFIITLILAVFSGGTAYNEVIQYEKFNSPRVITNLASFNKIKYTEADIPSAIHSSEILWEYDNTNYPPLKWRSDQLKFKVFNSVEMYLLSETETKAYYNFSGYTYLTEVRALPITDYLVVLVKLRATSRRSMLLIYDKDYNLMYEELLDRCGRKQYIGTTNDIDGEVLIVNICKPFVLNKNA